MIQEAKPPPETTRDKYDNYLKILSSCSCCKRCWIYLEGPLRGKCSYGGPFNGYTMVDDGATEEELQAPKDIPVPPV